MLMRPLQLRWTFLVGLVSIAALSVAACGDSDGPTAIPRGRITITAAESTFSLDRRVQFAAVVYDGRDSVVPGAAVSWTSSAPEIASVSDVGVVTALAEGTAKIVATSGDVRGEAPVRVTSTRMASFFQQKYCAVRTDGHVFCDNREAFPPGPRVAVPADVPFAQVRTGNEHACGLTADGEAYCWGTNTFLQLGVPNAITTDSALRVVTTERFQVVSTGLFYSCGLTVAGRAFCWGTDLLGNGVGRPAVTPAPVATQQTFTHLETGFDRTCALTSDGQVYCWGDLPELLDAPPHRFRTITVSVHMQCGVTTTNSVLCGEGRWFAEPTSSLGVPLAAVFPSGWDTNCGLTADGTAYCWGNNYWGQMGNGEMSAFDAVTPPMPVVGGLRFRSLHLSRTFTCGLALDGRTYCWGTDFPGVRLDDMPNRTPRPVQVFLVP